MSYCTDDCYSVYDERRRLARKAHICSACREAIEPNHLYWSVAIVFDGTASRVKRCLRCQAIHKHLRQLGDHDVWPDERLDCGESYEDEWGETPPEIARLAFVSGADLQASATQETEANR